MPARPPASTGRWPRCSARDRRTASASRWADAALAAALFAVDPVGLGGVHVRAARRTGARSLARACARAAAAGRAVAAHPAARDRRAPARRPRPRRDARRRPAGRRTGPARRRRRRRRGAADGRTHRRRHGRAHRHRDGYAVASRWSATVSRERCRRASACSRSTKRRNPTSVRRAGLVDRLAFAIALDGDPRRGRSTLRGAPTGIAGRRACALAAASPWRPRWSRRCAPRRPRSASTACVRRSSRCAPRAPPRRWPGRGEATAEDAAVAARLVLAPRATRLPRIAGRRAQRQPPEPARDDSTGGSEDDAGPARDAPLEDMVLAAAQAAIPAQLLAELALAHRLDTPRAGAGGAGATRVAAHAGQADRRAPRRPEARRAPRCARDAARRRAVAAVAPARVGRAGRARRGAPRRLPPEALSRAHADHGDLRRRRERLVGAASPGRGEGRGRAAAGAVLRAARPRGAARVPRPRLRAAAVADALAGAREAQPGRLAGRWRHAARGRHRSGGRARRVGPAPGRNADRRPAHRRPRERGARRHRRPRPRRGRGAGGGAPRRRAGADDAAGGHVAAAAAAGEGARRRRCARSTCRCRTPARRRSRRR